MTNEPYNFSTTATGLMFLSALIGSIFGYFTGVFADTIVVFLARLSFVYAGLGYLLYGWAADSGLPWISVAIGLGAMIAHQVSACSIATAYAMDCFPGVSLKLQLHIYRGCRLFMLTTIDLHRSPARSSSSSPSARRASTSPSRSPCSTSSMPQATDPSSPSTPSWSC